MRILASLAALLIAPLAAGQTVLYVDADAPGPGDGASWATAFPELRDALAAAAPGSQIWVARGTYRPTDVNDRTATFELRPGVEVLGGFVGTETAADERLADPATNGTVLSGDIGALGSPFDNAFHVVTALGVDGAAVLDGFTVTGGRADASSAPNDRGGGLTNYDGGSSAPDTEGFPTLRNLRFVDNEATRGGGVYLGETAAPVRVEAVAFVDNAASEWGGGLLSLADLEMDAVTFEANAATNRGGGAYFGGAAAVVMRRAAFVANAVGGGETNSRGAGFNAVSEAAITLVRADFVRNAAPMDDTGDGGGFNVAESARVDLVNARFLGNVARSGAAFFSRGDTRVSVANAVVVGNRSQEDDAASVVTATAGASVALADVTLAGNRANAVIATNSADELQLQNGILWDNAGISILTLSGSSVGVDHAVVEGGFAGGTSVSVSDPMFYVAPAAGPDGEWGTDDDLYGDLRLEPGSPAVDAGDVGLVPDDVFDLDGDGITDEPLPVDLDGEPRVQDAGVELGAYEGTDPAVSAERAPAGQTAGVTLSAPAPNPTRGRATVQVSLAAAAVVELTVTDALGRQLRVLHRGPLSAGTHTVPFDVAGLAAGTYLVRASSGAGAASRPFAVVR